MATKPRSPGQTAISVSLDGGLLARIDERAGALGLNRSQYLAQLARADLQKRGELRLQEEINEHAATIRSPKRKAV